MLQHINNSAAVGFYDLANPQAQPTGVGLGSGKAWGIEWVDNENVLFLVSASERLNFGSGIETIEIARWFSISKTARKPRIMFGNEMGWVIGDPGTFLYTKQDGSGDAAFARWTSRARTTGAGGGPSRMSADSGLGYSLFDINVVTADSKQSARGEEDTVDWIVDGAGEPLLRIDYDEGRQVREIYARRADTNRFDLLASFPEKRGDDELFHLVGLAPTAGRMLATSYGDRDKRSLVEFDLATGALGATVFTNDQHDIDYALYDPSRATAVGVVYTDDLPRAFHVDSKVQKAQESLAKALPGAAPMIVSRSADDTKMIVRAVYTDHPDQIFLYDSAARSLSMLAPTYSGLDGKVFAKKEKYDYVAADGLAIHGYLTVPQGASKSNMPLIVLPHGGPEGRDDQSFDWWSFFYAARGYLVYQPNFRGSDGYGYRFRSAGYGEWGRKMQDDISEGVKKLIADGVVDASRVCIVGASYGGYAALAGATLTPELYACAVSVNGVSNLPGMLGAEARSSEISGDYWQKRIGNRFRGEAELLSVSPVARADNIKAPVMIIHSKNDVVVPIGQSVQMHDALTAAGKSHEFVELPGEDHWLKNGATRTEMLAKSIEFIDKHIGASAN